jgi:hypothetical protein
MARNDRKTNVIHISFMQLLHGNCTNDRETPGSADPHATLPPFPIEALLTRMAHQLDGARTGELLSGSILEEDLKTGEHLGEATAPERIHGLPQYLGDPQLEGEGTLTAEACRFPETTRQP